MFFVHTLDASGQASVGTAFVVSSNTTQSLLLTSYTTVKAATVAPGPTVFVRQGNVDTPVTVRAWDPQYDLAYWCCPSPRLHVLPAAPRRTRPAARRPDLCRVRPGLRGGIDRPGTLIDVAASGMTEDAAIGPAFQGGPLINRRARWLRSRHGPTRPWVFH